MAASAFSEEKIARVVTGSVAEMRDPNSPASRRGTEAATQLDLDETVILEDLAELGSPQVPSLWVPIQGFLQFPY